MSKKSWPILDRKLLYKMGQDFLDIQYSNDNKLILLYCISKKSWPILDYKLRYKMIQDIQYSNDNKLKLLNYY